MAWQPRIKSGTESRSDVVEDTLEMQADDTVVEKKPKRRESREARRRRQGTLRENVVWFLQDFDSVENLTAFLWGVSGTVLPFLLFSPLIAIGVGASAYFLTVLIWCGWRRRMFDFIDGWRRSSGRPPGDWCSSSLFVPHYTLSFMGGMAVSIPFMA